MTRVRHPGTKFWLSSRGKEGAQSAPSFSLDVPGGFFFWGGRVGVKVNPSSNPSRE